MSRNWMRAALIFLLCCFGFGQQQSDQQQGSNNQQNSSGQQQQPQQQQQQAPPEQKKSKFGGLLHKPVTASNSNQSKDTASLGPNGLDPDGMPTKSQMDESASADDDAKAAALAQQTTPADEVNQFIQQGNLKNGRS